jgi:hypothetical protein
MRRRRSLVAVGCTLWLAATACKGKAPGGVVHLKEVNDAFASAGWKTADFQPADSLHFSAQRCVTGAIQGIETLLCEFGSVDAVARGKKAAEAWVAQATTGAVLANGLTLLAVADRAHVDPRGQTIHKITKVYNSTR